ncbi:hypothetical protein CDD81_6050 [Ophiocordyceps australis]|uniref:Uncharacterized protein n=1 Tax=Ophiocordyceps australis TaxID=1399860 RepID=A0A2C5Y6U3_9HYPO|nr:hypothetical protein CDD81_6050 [Ophiocordyceps australis]
MADKMHMFYMAKCLGSLDDLLDLQVFENTWKACIQIQEPQQNIPQQPNNWDPLPFALVALDALDKLDFASGHLTYSLEPATLAMSDRDATVQAIGSMLALLLYSAVHDTAYSWLHRNLEEHNQYPGALVLLQRHLFVLRARIAQCRRHGFRQQDMTHLIGLCNRLYLSFCSIQHRPRYQPSITNWPLDPTQFDTWLNGDGQDAQQWPSTISFGQWVKRKKHG